MVCNSLKNWMEFKETFLLLSFFFFCQNLNRVSLEKWLFDFVYKNITTDKGSKIRTEYIRWKKDSKFSLVNSERHVLQVILNIFHSKILHS